MQSDGPSRLKKLGTYGIGLLVVVGVLLLTALLLRGIVWVSDEAWPWLMGAVKIAIDICVFVLLPLCIFRKTRPWAGVGFYCASFVFGISLFAYSCLVVVELWGYGALAVGLIFAGVGVVPVAALAALFHAEWTVLGGLVLAVVLTFGTRLLGVWLMEVKTKEEALEDVSEVIAPTIPGELSDGKAREGTL